jgi:hypothetical protein
MKKLAILSIVLLLVFPFGQIKALPTIAKAKIEIKKEKKQDQKPDRPALKKLEGNTVSQDSQTSFYLSIGNLPNVAWTRDINYDVAAYTKKGLEMKAYFDGDGAFVGTTTKKASTDLSSSIQKKIQKLYSDYAVGQILFFQDNSDNSTDMTLYGVQFEGQDVYLIELSKSDSKLVVMYDNQGELSLFKQL